MQVQVFLRPRMVNLLVELDERHLAIAPDYPAPNRLRRDWRPRRLVWRLPQLLLTPLPLLLLLQLLLKHVLLETHLGSSLRLPCVFSRRFSRRLSSLLRRRLRCLLASSLLLGGRSLRWTSRWSHVHGAEAVDVRVEEERHVRACPRKLGLDVLLPDENLTLVLVYHWVVNRLSGNDPTELPQPSLHLPQEPLGIHLCPGCPPGLGSRLGTRRIALRLFRRLRLRLPLRLALHGGLRLSLPSFFRMPLRFAGKGGHRGFLGRRRRLRHRLRRETTGSDVHSTETVGVLVDEEAHDGAHARQFGFHVLLAEKELAIPLRGRGVVKGLGRLDPSELAPPLDDLSCDAAGNNLRPLLRSHGHCSLAHFRRTDDTRSRD
mmetsp:Transcript_85153/g.237672  ORF Transcript_85153/g.237672 Transcript_85153/m.237672 type:complete len:375 (-) Transcript_85153:26-1150(-)